MRNRSDVLDARDTNAEGIESTNGGFATGAGAHDAHFNVLQTEFLGNLASVFGSNLSGKGSALAGALEALSAGGAGGDGITLTVGKVMVMIVLLKEACTWAMPSVTTFFTFLRPRAAC